MHPLERLYLSIHRSVYDRRAGNAVTIEGAHVVSVGNLSAGGTGKTPTAAFLAEHGRRCSPLIVLRGYGGRGIPKSGLLVSAGAGPLVDWRVSGDEAALLARIQGVRVVVGADRVAATAQFRSDARLVILDDAFQNPSLRRDCELVLVDATVSPDDVRLFPLGRFRDPPESLERASAVLLTRADSAPQAFVDHWRETCARYLPSERVFTGAHESVGISPQLPAGSPVAVFAGIGNFEAFVRTAASLGLRVDEQRRFRDHHAYSAADIRKLAAGAPGLPWVTTAKDAVRLPEGLPVDLAGRLHVLDVRLAISDDRAVDFAKLVLGPCAD